jgi:hypothetical protein
MHVFGKIINIYFDLKELVNSLKSKYSVCIQSLKNIINSTGFFLIVFNNISVLYKKKFISANGSIIPHHNLKADVKVTKKTSTALDVTFHKLLLSLRAILWCISNFH